MQLTIKMYIKLLILLFFCAILSLSAQDTLFMKGKYPIVIRYIAIKGDSVGFIHYADPNPTIKWIGTSELTAISYHNGAIVKYPLNPKKDSISTLPPSNLPFPKGKALSYNIHDTSFANGIADDKAFYRGYRPASTGVLLSSIVMSPIAGLLLAIETSSSRPQTHTLTFLDADRSKNTNYQAGYLYQSWEMKQNKV